MCQTSECVEKACYSALSISWNLFERSSFFFECYTYTCCTSELFHLQVHHVMHSAFQLARPSKMPIDCKKKSFIRAPHCSSCLLSVHEERLLLTIIYQYILLLCPIELKQINAYHELIWYLCLPFCNYVVFFCFFFCRWHKPVQEWTYSGGTSRNEANMDSRLSSASSVPYGNSFKTW